MFPHFRAYNCIVGTVKIGVLHRLLCRALLDMTLYHPTLTALQSWNRGPELQCLFSRISFTAKSFDLLLSILKELSKWPGEIDIDGSLASLQWLCSGPLLNCTCTRMRMPTCIHVGIQVRGERWPSWYCSIRNSAAPQYVPRGPELQGLPSCLNSIARTNFKTPKRDAVKLHGVHVVAGMSPYVLWRGGGRGEGFGTAFAFESHRLRVKILYKHHAFIKQTCLYQTYTQQCYKKKSSSGLTQTNNWSAVKSSE